MSRAAISRRACPRAPPSGRGEGPTGFVAGLATGSWFNGGSARMSSILPAGMSSVRVGPGQPVDRRERSAGVEAREAPVPVDRLAVHVHALDRA